MVALKLHNGTANGFFWKIRIESAVLMKETRRNVLQRCGELVKRILRGEWVVLPGETLRRSTCLFEKRYGSHRTNSLDRNFLSVLFLN